MPIAIVMSRGDIVPAVIHQDTSGGLIDALNELSECPGINSEIAAKEWLMQLPEPSGWYNHINEARAAIQRLKRDQEVMSPKEVADAQKHLGLSNAEMADLLGIGGNPNTKKTEVDKLKTGRKKMGPERTRKLQAILSEYSLGADNN